MVDPRGSANTYTRTGTRIRCSHSHTHSHTHCHTHCHAHCHTHTHTHTHTHKRKQLLDRAVLTKRLGSFLLRCGSTGDTVIGTQPQSRASSCRTPPTPWCRCIPAYRLCMYTYSVHCCACGRCGRVLQLSQPHVCGPAFVVASAVPSPHPSRADHWDEDSSETRSAKPSSVELASRRWCGYSQRHGPVMYTACISTLPRRSQRGDIVPTAASGEVACPTLLVLPRSVFSRTPYLPPV